jgi:quercetin dioxygenase-like cupin family protein
MGFKAVHYSEINAEGMDECGVGNVNIRWLITQKDGAEHFAMRYFEMAPGGQSPHHSHEWEHEVFILDGTCLVVCGNQQKKVGAGYAVFIPPNTIHHFENKGANILRFLCLVPHHE